MGKYCDGGHCGLVLVSDNGGDSIICFDTAIRDDVRLLAFKH